MNNIIRIAGINYIINFIDDLSNDQECSGRVLIKKGEILIDSSMCQDMRNATILHEVLEVINSENELKLEHHVIQCLATQLYQVLKDNKEVF